MLRFLGSFLLLTGEASHEQIGESSRIKGYSDIFYLPDQRIWFDAADRRL